MNVEDRADYVVNQEQDAPPMAQEFPDGERIIFLGEMAYGTAGQVSATTEKTLDIGLAVSWRIHAQFIDTQE